MLLLLLLLLLPVVVRGEQATISQWGDPTENDAYRPIAADIGSHINVCIYYINVCPRLLKRWTWSMSITLPAMIPSPSFLLSVCFYLRGRTTQNPDSSRHKFCPYPPPLLLLALSRMSNIFI